MICKAVRIPNGEPGSFTGWYTHVRGSMITRRQALAVLIFGPMRSRIDYVQTQDKEWR